MIKHLLNKKPKKNCILTSAPNVLTKTASALKLDGGPNRSALGERGGENISSFRRDSLPQETVLDDLLDAAFFPMCKLIEKTN